MPTIYIDMDGVVADWDSAARAVIGDRVKDLNNRWPDEDWQQIKTIEHFYRDLPKMPRADDLMLIAKAFRDNLGWNLKMLTAIPRENDMPNAFHDKIKWMGQYYPGIDVIFGPYSKDKQRHCQPGDILVDDRKSNIEEWENAGGTVVRVTADYDKAISDLEDIYNRLATRINIDSLLYLD